MGNVCPIDSTASPMDIAGPQGAACWADSLPVVGRRDFHRVLVIVVWGWEVRRDKGRHTSLHLEEFHV